MQIKVLDHIIIGENRYFSFADAGLIEKYNSDFLSLKEEKELKPERH
jgi:DNA repair protein RadC